MSEQERLAQWVQEVFALLSQERPASEVQEQLALDARVRSPVAQV